MKTASAPRSRRRIGQRSRGHGKNGRHPAVGAAPKEKPISCERAAAILRAADRMLTSDDRKQIAAGIEEARRRMNNEHLH